MYPCLKAQPLLGKDSPLPLNWGLFKERMERDTCPANKMPPGWSQVRLLGCWIPFSSVAQSCPTLCDPIDCGTPGLPVHHQIPELAQTHVHQVGDAIQPSHPLSSPSPPTFNLSQHQGLFTWVSSSHQVAKGLEFQLQSSVLLRSIQDWFPLGCTGWISLQSKGLSRVFSNTTVQKH